MRSLRRMTTTFLVCLYANARIVRAMMSRAIPVVRGDRRDRRFPMNRRSHGGGSVLRWLSPSRRECTSHFAFQLRCDHRVRMTNRFQTATAASVCSTISCSLRFPGASPLRLRQTGGRERDLAGHRPGVEEVEGRWADDRPKPRVRGDYGIAYLVISALSTACFSVRLSARS